MATVKEIKAELDKRGIKYNPKALKADLDNLLNETPRHKISKRYIGSSGFVEPDVFIDPNANPATQA